MLLIDTNVAIRLRDGDQRAVDLLDRWRDPFVISLVTVIELKGGLDTRPELRAFRRSSLDHLLGRTQVLPLNDAVVTVYGEMVETLGFSRRLVFDRLIAATAIAHDVSLFTLNPDDFRDIPGLSLQVWPNPQ